MNDTTADEERILRVWTPIILRTILMGAIVILLVGLLSIERQSPGYYVTHFHRLQTVGHSQNRESIAALVSASLKGQSRSIMTLGLMVLTLVPLARVAFCFLLFVKERDGIYVVFTAYVLIGLVVGVVLGRVG
ncbi:MAG TPA: DUF1634 domain-containing protein [Candidatus Binataceae bacterium]|nr:DUF1634 domain-containing protein [Candidatus Binataceae bacterium]